MFGVYPMATTKDIRLGRVRDPRRKGIGFTRGNLVPLKGHLRSNVEFEANMYLLDNDVVEYYMDKGEPVVVRKVKKR